MCFLYRILYSIECTLLINLHRCYCQVFVSYLTSAANDICKEAKRQTISAEDVFTALQDLDFGELVPPTKDALEGSIIFGVKHRC